MVHNPIYSVRKQGNKFGVYAQTITPVKPNEDLKATDITMQRRQISQSRKSRRKNTGSPLRKPKLNFNMVAKELSMIRNIQ